MKQYVDLITEILESGETKEDRTGTGTISVFGTQHKYDLRKGFPLVTTKKMPFKVIVSELLCFIRGETSKQAFKDMNCHIWDEWCNPKKVPEGLSEEERKAFQLKEDDLGRIYGKQWTDWKGYISRNETVISEGSLYETRVDKDGFAVGEYSPYSVNQLQNAIDTIKTNPDSRRIIVSAWNPAELDQMALPPCHMFFQFYVVNGRLDCQLYQRSADVALGVPFNIASYAVLMHMVAKECDLEAGIFTHTIGDAHIYLDHVDKINEQITREPMELCQLNIADGKGFWDYDLEDFSIESYKSHPKIEYPIAV
jgi:thymidylate synthase